MTRWHRATLVAALILAGITTAWSQAVRQTPDSTNSALPIDAREYQRDVNAEVKALWKRIPEKLASVAGTNTLTATAASADTAALTAYGNLVILRPANTNTGAVTLNVDSLGAKNVLDIDGNALSAGELVANRDHLLYYDGSAYRMIANGSAPPPTVAQPGPVLIDTQTASSSSALVFTTGFNNTYDRYVLLIETLKPASDDVQLLLRISTDGGSTWKQGASDYRWQISSHLDNNVVSEQASSGAASDNIWLSTTGGGTSALGNGAGKAYFGTVEFTNPEDSATFFQVMHRGRYLASYGGSVTTYGGGSYATAAAVNGIQIRLGSGNIASATGRLYGWPK